MFMCLPLQSLVASSEAVASATGRMFSCHVFKQAIKTLKAFYFWSEERNLEFRAAHSFSTNCSFYNLVFAQQFGMKRCKSCGEQFLTGQCFKLVGDSYNLEPAFSGKHQL